MADILERKIPYLFPGDLELRLDAQNFITAISGYPVGGGGGTIVESDFIWKPVINQDGTIGWVRDTSATTPATANLVPHIYNNYWYIGTSNTNVEARGPQGPAGADGTNGTDGTDGEDGYSPVVSIDDSVQGQHTITITDETHQAEPHEFIVYDGTDGDNGDPGYAPIVTTKTVTGQGHNNSGTEITITYGEAGAQTAVYTAWNGNDGAGATVTLTGGEGIEVSQAGTNYTISVSADYALKSDIPTTVAELTDSADYAKKTDLEGFVTSSDITTQDTDYVMTTTGWKVLTLPGGGMTQVIHDATLTGQGNANDSKLGVAWSALSAYTITSALSAGWAVSAKGANSEYKIGTWLDALSEFRTDIITWSNEITGSSGIEVSLNEYDYPVNFHLTETAYNAITSVSGKLDTTAAAQTYQTVAGMSNYLTTAQYETDSAKYVTSGNEISAANEQYALTTTGWVKIVTPATFTGVTTTGSISGGGVNNDTIGLLTSAENALTAVDNKVNKPDTTQTVLNNNYLIYSTLTGEGATTGWMPLSANYYSKSEANGTFVATANIDTTTLSGDGKSVSTKLGVKTDVIATIDYVNSSFLPTSGGTVSGQLTVSGSNFDNNLHLIRDNNNGFIGLANNGAITIKNVISNSTSQIEFLTSANKTFDITVKDNNSSPQPVGKLYVMSAHSLADATATSANWANDGMLHIILES